MSRPGSGQARRPGCAGQSLDLARDLGFVDEALYQQLQERTTEVKRMLTAFIRKLPLTADG
jgi:hypothetical protein